MEKQPKAMLHQHCHFPRAIRRDTKELQYKTIGIFDREDAVTALEQHRQPLRDLVLNVWAILLRYYVQSDNVAFLVWSGSLGHDAVESTESKSCFGDEIEAVTLQYQLFDNLLLHDVRPSQSTKCTDHEMGDVRINTLVRFSSFCASSSLQEHEVNTSSTRAEDAMAVDNVSLALSRVLPSRFHAQPEISVEYDIKKNQRL